jgi:rhodanese-related sulfurtransferase
MVGEILATLMGSSNSSHHRRAPRRLEFGCPAPFETDKNPVADHSPKFLELVTEARRRIREIPASELPALLAQTPGARLIDVREESEYAAGHVKGAEHLGKGVIERDIEVRHPDHGTTLFLYCGGGYRSALAADNLRKMGYDNAISVDGGWRALKDLMPTE